MLTQAHQVTLRAIWDNVRSKLFNGGREPMIDHSIILEMHSGRPEIIGVHKDESLRLSILLDSVRLQKSESVFLPELPKKQPDLTSCHSS